MPGTTLSTAQNIGYLTSFSYNDFVGTTNQYDWYKFSLLETRTVYLYLNGITDGYVYESIVLDKNNNGIQDYGEELYYDSASSSDYAYINVTLGAGTYFVKINQSSSNNNSNYYLELGATATPPSTLYDPGNTFANAYNIDYLTGTKTFNDFVGTVDNLDYYKFSLSGTSTVSVYLSGITDGYVYESIVLDKNNNGIQDYGEELYYDSASSSDYAYINVTLGAGTYFVKINQSSSNNNSNYSLGLSSTLTPPSTFFNPGNTFASAYNIGNLTGTKNFNDFVGTVDNLDYYKFSLSGTSTVSVYLSGITDGYVYESIVLDKNNNGSQDYGEELYYDSASSSDYAYINVTLGAGTYFVKVNQSSSNNNSNYSLSLTNLTIPDPTSNTKVVRDFNSDSRNDLILQGLGWAGIWTMNGTTPTGWTTLPSTNGAAIKGAGDFTGDGKSDMILQGQGWAGIWTMNGTSVTGWIGLTSTGGATIAGVNDFNSDGKNDLILQGLGWAGIWIMNGTSVSSFVNLPSLNGATIAGAGDFNSDGKNDLVIQNLAQGWSGIWLMNGTQVTGWADLPSTGGAAITGIGDFNGDGKSDMTLQGQGWAGIWTMSGVSTSPITFIPLPTTNGATII